jgi:hypothetical protein
VNQDREQQRALCEYGNEPTGYIKYWEILGYMSVRRILKKYSALWS